MKPQSSTSVGGEVFFFSSAADYMCEEVSHYCRESRRKIGPRISQRFFLIKSQPSHGLKKTIITACVCIAVRFFFPRTLIFL